MAVERIRYGIVVLGVFSAAGMGCSPRAGSSSGSSGGGVNCTPGVQQACACLAGAQGVQVCKVDGSGFDACLGCGASSSSVGGSASVSRGASSSAATGSSTSASGSLPSSGAASSGTGTSSAVSASPSSSTGGGPTRGDPVTLALEGSHHTYNVGPGQEYAEPDTVPWGALVAGDVVNIFQRVTPYRWKLCLRGQGSPQDSIVINGVTDAAGTRPRFDFNGARTASGCNPGAGHDIFDTASIWSLEDHAGILVRPGVGDAYGYKPGHLVIKNLELGGAAPGNPFVNLGGQTTPYTGSPAAIWLQPSTDVLLENNVIYDNGFGIFLMSKDSTLDQACERITVRNNRVYGNGVVGSYLEHNLYVQSTNPVVEGNYFGPTRTGSQGSTYKSRSSGEIFRYNYVEASARAIDWVHSEDQRPGIATQADYGVDYAYGNVIVNDCGLGNCASNPIHYGGDNLGEQDNTATLFTPTTPYRSHLYFYNNTVVHRVDSSDAWRTSVFDLSLRGTSVDAWNNVFALMGTSNFSWLQSAGQLHLLGNNVASAPSLANASDTALAVNYSVTTTGNLVRVDPAFAAAAQHDFTPGAASPARDQATGAPAGVTPVARYVDIPVLRQPSPGRNGMVARTQVGTAMDLGALEGQ